MAKSARGSTRRFRALHTHTHTHTTRALCACTSMSLHSVDGTLASVSASLSTASRTPRLAPEARRALPAARHAQASGSHGSGVQREGLAGPAAPALGTGRGEWFCACRGSRGPPRGLQGQDQSLKQGNGTFSAWLCCEACLHEGPGPSLSSRANPCSQAALLQAPNCKHAGR